MEVGAISPSDSGSFVFYVCSCFVVYSLRQLEAIGSWDQASECRGQLTHAKDGGIMEIWSGKTTTKAICSSTVLTRNWQEKTCRGD